LQQQKDSRCYIQNKGSLQITFLLVINTQPIQNTYLLPTK
jgi:hypothetical protein